MSGRAIALAVLAGLAAGAALADDREQAGVPGAGIWGLDPNASAAALARDGWRFLAMSAMSWPDGRQAVVTMWGSPLGDFARCFDYFDAALVPTGGKCERSGTGL
jgi:hypothetical protein